MRVAAVGQKRLDHDLLVDLQPTILVADEPQERVQQCLPVPQGTQRLQGIDLAVKALLPDELRHLWRELAARLAQEAAPGGNEMAEIRALDLVVLDVAVRQAGKDGRDTREIRCRLRRRQSLQIFVKGKQISDMGKQALHACHVSLGECLLLQHRPHRVRNAAGPAAGAVFSGAQVRAVHEVEDEHAQAHQTVAEDQHLNAHRSVHPP